MSATQAAFLRRAVGCDACVAECGKHQADHCKRGVEVCRRCAEECRKIAA